MRRLKLSEWANLGDVVSAVAVVVSLLYVAYQINENTEEVRAASRQQLINRAHLATVSWATNPQLHRVMAKVTEGAELTPHEKIQFGFVVRAVLYDVQEAFLLHREGRLDEDYWNTRIALVTNYLSSPQARAFYLQQKSTGIYHREFVNWMDETLEPHPADNLEQE